MNLKYELNHFHAFMTFVLFMNPLEFRRRALRWSALLSDKPVERDFAAYWRRNYRRWALVYVWQLLNHCCAVAAWHIEQDVKRMRKICSDAIWTIREMSIAWRENGDSND